MKNNKNAFLSINLSKLLFSYNIINFYVFLFEIKLK